MKVVNKSIFFIITMFLLSCSSKDDNTDNITNDENQVDEPQVDEPIVESKEVLNLINWETISDTPVEIFHSHIVHENKLFSLSYKDTYVFDFELATWNLIATGTNNVLPVNGFGIPAINFIRNGKWNMFTERGLFEFDFELKNWSVIKGFPQVNGLFTTQGFYVEEDLAIYFVDNSNKNETIYKYDLETNELILHSEHDNEGSNGITHNGSLLINNTYYHAKPYSNGFIISKFNEDFTDLSLINSITANSSLSGSIAVPYGNYIIFGQGGAPTFGSDGMLESFNPTLKFYAYDTVNDVFTEMPSPFYESCRGAKVIVYNNEFYVINGFTIRNQKSEARNIIEKIEFDFVTQ